MIAYQNFKCIIIQLQSTNWYMALIDKGDLLYSYLFSNLKAVVNTAKTAQLYYGIALFIKSIELKRPNKNKNSFRMYT